jgi:hypothetical protein
MCDPALDGSYSPITKWIVDARSTDGFGSIIGSQSYVIGDDPLSNAALRMRIEANFSAMMSLDWVNWRSPVTLPAQHFDPLPLRWGDDGFEYAALITSFVVGAERYFVARRPLGQKDVSEVAGPFSLPPIEPPTQKNGGPVPMHIGLFKPTIDDIASYSRKPIPRQPFPTFSFPSVITLPGQGRKSVSTTLPAGFPAAAMGYGRGMSPSSGARLSA